VVARDAAVIRIDAVWLAVDPVDMRAGADRLLASVVQVFGAAVADDSYFVEALFCYYLVALVYLGVAGKAEGCTT
jgi:hypothetical protein